MELLKESLLTHFNFSQKSKSKSFRYLSNLNKHSNLKKARKSPKNATKFFDHFFLLDVFASTQMPILVFVSIFISFIYTISIRKLNFPFTAKWHSNRIMLLNFREHTSTVIWLYNVKYSIGMSVAKKFAKENRKNL